MLRNLALAAGAAIAFVAASSAPASATTCPAGQELTDFGCVAVEPVPEPLTILGSIAFGGALLGKKALDSQKADQ